MQYDVIVLPIIEWDHRFQRPQHLSSAFADDGHRVFYTDLTFSGWDSEVHSERARHNLWRVSLPGPPDHNRFLQPLPDDVVDLCVEALVELSRVKGIVEAIILVQQPFWARVALRLRQRKGWKIVYDCMDEHDGLTALNDEILREERGLAKSADLVVTSSRKLARKHEREARRHLLLPNAGEFAHFSEPGRLPNPLQGVTGPVIGYYGAIMDWFDVEMVRRAAAARRDWTFVLIGAVDIEDAGALQRLPNVRFLGEKPYAELPAYLHRFDVAIIPFRIVPIIEATNPVKFYEYLSAGKPVVASPIPELEPFPHLYRVARDGDELVAQVQAAMSEDSPAKARERTDWARRQTWDVRYSALKRAVDDLWGKASIVIVSYQNLEMITACVESIHRFTDYPDYEVIVVDNGSEAEVVGFLREFVSDHPRFRLIEAKENLGFAKANNLGMQSISDDSAFVVLLNNDTVVTTGWLSGLVRWLGDTTIGLVGPVTWPNGTANEAAVAVSYDNMEQMHAFAAEHVAAHRGRAFDIPMLAFFCVGMRREVMEEVGTLDEAYGLGMFEDDDYAIRVRNAGLRVVCAQDVFVHHVGRSSFGKLAKPVYGDLFERNKRYYENKWSVSWRPPAARSDVTLPATPVAVSPSRKLPGHVDLGLPSVSVILVNYNGLDHLGPCLESLSRLSFKRDRLEVVVVDNASIDGSVDWLQENWPNARIVRNDRNVGFSRACNQGVGVARGDYVAFLNNDMRVDPGWLNGLLELMARDPRIACAGSMVMNWDGTAAEFSGRHDDPFSLGYEPGNAPPARAADAYALFVSGGAMLLRKSDFLEAGGFDHRYFMYHEDVDLCWRLWTLGKRCCVAPHSVVYHRGGASSSKLDKEVVLGWGQKHLLWTVLKNFDDDSLRSALPLLIYFLVERGRWSEMCMQSLQDVFEETQAALGSILHERSMVQASRRSSDSEIFSRVGHPLAFVMRSPFFAAMAEELTRRHPSSDLDFRDPARVAEAMVKWFHAAVSLRAAHAAAWREDAGRKFARQYAKAGEAELPEAAPTIPAATGPVSVTTWGPQEGRKGQALNPLQSGNSSLWVMGEHLEAVTHLAVAGGAYACAHVDGLLTCELPERATRAMMKPGSYPVVLLTSDGGSIDLGTVTVAAAERVWMRRAGRLLRGVARRLRS